MKLCIRVGQVESCDAAQGNAFGSCQVGSCDIMRAPKETHSSWSGWVGSGQVMSCHEATQGNTFERVGSGRVGSCEGGRIKNAKL